MRSHFTGLHSPSQATCDHCGGLFSRPPSHIERNANHYCSVQCCHAASMMRRVQLVCKGCGQLFELKVTDLRRNRGHFCSQSCYIQHRRTEAERTFITRFWEKVDVGKPDECWHWKGAVDRKGYGKLGSPDGRTVSAHRIAYELANATTTAQWNVCHKCDNPRCCNPTHLFLGSRADNLKDMIAKGRNAKGERLSRKLTSQQVVSIRERYASGLATGVQLASELKVSKATISLIVNRKAWRQTDS